MKKAEFCRDRGDNNASLPNLQEYTIPFRGGLEVWCCVVAVHLTFVILHLALSFVVVARLLLDSHVAGEVVAGDDFIEVGSGDGVSVW